MNDEIVTDARVYFHTEQSKPVITLCVEETQGDTRLFHRDFHLDLNHVLILKKCIDVLDFDELQKVL